MFKYSFDGFPRITNSSQETWLVNRRKQETAFEKVSGKVFTNLETGLDPFCKLN